MLMEKYALRYLPLFYEELEHDVDYIANKLCDPDAANRLLDDLETAILNRTVKNRGNFSVNLKNAQRIWW